MKPSDEGVHRNRSSRETASCGHGRNGFSWRGPKNESRNFNDNDVRRVLERYGNGGGDVCPVGQWDSPAFYLYPIKMSIPMDCLYLSP